MMLLINDDIYGLIDIKQFFIFYNKINYEI